MSDATLARMEHGKYVGVREESRHDGVCTLRKQTPYALLTPKKVGARFKNVGRSWQTTHAGAGLLRPTLRVDAARYRRAASVRHARRAARERARLRAARHAALRCCIFSPH